METVIANLLEPGDKIIVGNNGIWGSRVCDLAGRYQGDQCSSCGPTCACPAHCIHSPPTAFQVLHLVFQMLEAPCPFQDVHTALLSITAVPQHSR